MMCWQKKWEQVTTKIMAHLYGMILINMLIMCRPFEKGCGSKNDSVIGFPYSVNVLMWIFDHGLLTITHSKLNHRHALDLNEEYIQRFLKALIRRCSQQIEDVGSKWCGYSLLCAEHITVFSLYLRLVEFDFASISQFLFFHWKPETASSPKLLHSLYLSNV